jgi:hypothetical protein
VTLRTSEALTASEQITKTQLINNENQGRLNPEQLEQITPTQIFPLPTFLPYVPPHYSVPYSSPCKMWVQVSNLKKFLLACARCILVQFQHLKIHIH